MKSKFQLMIVLIIFSVLALITVLLVLAYNDIGPIRFVGGYPGFP